MGKNVQTFFQFWAIHSNNNFSMYLTGDKIIRLKMYFYVKGTGKMLFLQLQLSF